MVPRSMTVVGFGLVTNSYASWLSWQGYLLGPFGLGGKTGAWESANLGVIVTLAIAFLGWVALGRATVRRQEATSASVNGSIPASLAPSSAVS